MTHHLTGEEVLELAVYEVSIKKSTINSECAPWRQLS